MILFQAFFGFMSKPFDRIHPSHVGVSSDHIPESSSTDSVPPFFSGALDVQDIDPEDEPAERHLIMHNVCIIFGHEEINFFLHKIFPNPNMMLPQLPLQFPVLQHFWEGELVSFFFDFFSLFLELLIDWVEDIRLDVGSLVFFHECINIYNE